MCLIQTFWSFQDPALCFNRGVFSVLQYKGAHVKPGFAEHFYSNPGRYKGRENMLVSQNFIADDMKERIYFTGLSSDIYAQHS